MFPRVVNIWNQPIWQIDAAQKQKKVVQDATNLEERFHKSWNQKTVTNITFKIDNNKFYP